MRGKKVSTLSKVVSDWLKHKGGFFSKALGKRGDEQPPRCYADTSRGESPAAPGAGTVQSLHSDPETDTQAHFGSRAAVGGHYLSTTFSSGASACFSQLQCSNKINTQEVKFLWKL